MNKLKTAIFTTCLVFLSTEVAANWFKKKVVDLLDNPDWIADKTHAQKPTINDILDK